MVNDYSRTQEKLETRGRRMSFARHFAINSDRCDIDQVTIDVLPDNVLLEIFNFYMQEARPFPYARIEAWHTFVHVCRHWRSIIFASPFRLNLRLLCTDKTPVREMPNIWPPLPICIQGHNSISDMDSIIASLEHKDRICQISLDEVPDPLLEKICAALMQESFPALKHLLLVSPLGTKFVAPPGPFSGGSAPLLQEAILEDVAFPELLNFLSSSANHLAYLSLSNISHSGYISPDAMVTCISALIGLEKLHIVTRSSQSHPYRESRRPHLPTRSVQPSLLVFVFRGTSEYLEDFVARIDAPQLDHLNITFSGKTVFDIPQLVQFIHRIPSLKALDEARVRFSDLFVYIFITNPGPWLRKVLHRNHLRRV